MRANFRVRRPRTRIRTAPNKAFDRILISLALVGCADLLVKREVVASLRPGDRQTVVPHVLALALVHNAHGAMGLFGSRPVLLVALALATIGALAALLATPLRTSSATQIGFGMVVGGALGNVVDRVVHGYVIDYVAVTRFYVFNLADACISCGLVLIALPALRSRPRA